MGGARGASSGKGRTWTATAAGGLTRSPRAAGDTGSAGSREADEIAAESASSGRGDRGSAAPCAIRSRRGRGCGSGVPRPGPGTGTNRSALRLTRSRDRHNRSVLRLTCINLAQNSGRRGPRRVVAHAKGRANCATRGPGTRKCGAGSVSSGGGTRAGGVLFASGRAWSRRSRIALRVPVRAGGSAARRAALPLGEAGADRGGCRSARRVPRR